MFAQARHQRIAALLEEQGRWSVRDLQARTGASAATLRRDLAFLARAGRLVRSHGGVMRPGLGGAEPDFERKLRTAAAAKRALAAAALALVPARATVFVDAGTTTLEAGRQLLGREGVTVYTNSLPLLAEPPGGPARVVALGGEVRPLSRALVGGLALAWLEHLRFDVALIGASGLEEAAGPSTTELLEAAVKRAALGRARRTVLLADASKWAEPAAVRFAGWQDFSDLVTDRRPDRAARAALARGGVRVHVAG